MTDEENWLNYMNELPEGLRTPDTVETRIGTLNFWDGVPTQLGLAVALPNLLN